MAAWWMIPVALADGRLTAAPHALELTGPASATPGELVELVVRGPGAGTVHLLGAASVGRPVSRPDALGAAVLELSQPIGAVSTRPFRGEARFFVRMPAERRAWQVVLVAGGQRAASNAVVVASGAETPRTASVGASGAGPTAGPATGSIAPGRAAGGIVVGAPAGSAAPAGGTAPAGRRKGVGSTAAADTAEDTHKP